MTGGRTGIIPSPVLPVFINAHTNARAHTHARIVALPVLTVVAVVVAVLLSTVLFSGIASAGVSPAEGRFIHDGDTVIIGETNLTFVDNAGRIIPTGTIICRKGDIQSAPIHFDGTFDSSRAEVEEKLKLGTCTVRGSGGYGEIEVLFIEPRVNVKTRVNDEDFGWVMHGEGINITFVADTNLNITGGNISFKLIDPSNKRLYSINGKSLLNIAVDATGNASIRFNSTANLDIGTYTLSIETDPNTNNGLDVEGPGVKFEVRRNGVESIEARPAATPVSEDVEFTVKTTPHTNLTLEVTHGIESTVLFTAIPTYDTSISADRHSVHHGKSDEDGEFKVLAEFDDTGTYEITATELVASTTASVEVKVKPPVAELLKPEAKYYYIGEKLEVSGKAYGGKGVTVKIEGDERFSCDNVPLGTKGEFKCPDKWDTDGLAPGKYRIEVWVLPSSNPETEPPDDSTIVILLRGGLTAEVSRNFVAQGDDFKVSGRAKSGDRVDILIISPRGGNGRGLDYTDIFNETGGSEDVPGMVHYVRAVNVTDDKFETDDIRVPRDADTGSYLIVVLSYGEDKRWGTKTGTSDLLNALRYINGQHTELKLKTQRELLELIMDRTVNQPGSDDLLAALKIRVENPYLRLSELEDVQLGAELKVSGVTNREEGTTIAVTVEGPVKLKPKFTEVKKDTEYNNKFEVSFATTGARIGTYVVTADDGYGHEDTESVDIVVPVGNLTPPPTAGGIPAPAPGNRTGANATQGNQTPVGGNNISMRLAAAMRHREFTTVVSIAGAVAAAVIIGASVIMLRRRRNVPPYKRKVLRTLPPPPGKRGRFRRI